MSHPFATTEGLDISEQGRTADGQVVRLDRRLFMQLYAFGECSSTEFVTESLREQPFGSVLYADANDPYGIALLTFTEDPNFFVTSSLTDANDSLDNSTALETSTRPLP